MARETRTVTQIEANELDMEIFRVVAKIDRFANSYNDDNVRDIAAHLDASRHRIRRHMHPSDRDATNG